MEPKEIAKASLQDRWDSLSGAVFNSTIGTNSDGTFWIKAPIDDARVSAIEEEASGVMAGLTSALWNPVSTAMKAGQAAVRYTYETSTKGTTAEISMLIHDTDRNLRSTNKDCQALIRLRQAINAAFQSISNLAETELTGQTHLRALSTNERKQRSGWYREQNIKVKGLFNGVIKPLIRQKTYDYMQNLLTRLYEGTADLSLEYYDAQHVNEYLSEVYSKEALDKVLKANKWENENSHTPRRIFFLLIEILVNLTPETLNYILNPQKNGLALKFASTETHMSTTDVLARLRNVKQKPGVLESCPKDQLDLIEMTNSTQLASRPQRPCDHIVYLLHLAKLLSPPNKRFIFPFRHPISNAFVLMEGKSTFHSVHTKTSLIKELYPNVDRYYRDTTYYYLSFGQNHHEIVLSMLSVVRRMVKKLNKIYTSANRFFNLELIVEGKSGYYAFKWLEIMVKEHMSFFSKFGSLTLNIYGNARLNPVIDGSIATALQQIPKNRFKINLISSVDGAFGKDSIIPGLDMNMNQFKSNYPNLGVSMEDTTTTNFPRADPDPSIMYG